MTTNFAVASHWSSDFDERSMEGWAKLLRRQLRAPRVSLGLVFLTPRFFPHAEQVLELVRVHAEIPLLLGCSSNALIVGDQEVESEAGVVLALYSLPRAELRGYHFTQEQVEEASGPAYWHHETGVGAEQTNGWLVFADPYQFDGEGWLRRWNEAYPGRPVVGGLASGEPSQGFTQVYLNGKVFEEGAVAVAFGGEVELRSVISQGCTPIGETWTITRVERNLIQEIANRPAYQVLLETFNGLPADEQRRAQGNLFIGLVINEYQEEFRRGDFLIRNLLGADPASGVLAVGALPRLGQTIQFQRRDAAAATEDMTVLLSRAHKELAGATVYGGCLCACNGRGQRLFGRPHHDASLVQRYLGPLPLAGFFCNGEIGPVGERNFLHGYTASLALFVKAGDR